MKLKVVTRWAYQEEHIELKRTVPQNHIISKLHNNRAKAQNCTNNHNLSTAVSPIWFLDKRTCKICWS